MSSVYLLEVWWLLKELVEMGKKEKKTVVAPPAATGLPAQMDLGCLECTPPCA